MNKLKTTVREQNNTRTTKHQSTFWRHWRGTKAFTTSQQLTMYVRQVLRFILHTKLHHITDVTPRNSSNSPYKDYNIWLLMNETWPLKGLPTLHSTCSTTPKQHLPLQPWEELAADILCLTWIIDFTFFALKISIFRLFLHHFLPFGKFHQNHISRSVKRQRRQQHLSTF